MNRDHKTNKTRIRTMERVLGVVIYAMLAGWLALAALIFVVPWAGIDVVFLSLKLKFLILVVFVLTITLTVTNVILYSAIERRYEKESR